MSVWNGLFNRYFKLNSFEGESKITLLSKAVREHIRPGIHVYSAYLPFAVTHEITRQFRGKKADLTVSCLGGIENINVLIAQGLVTRLVTSYAGLILPSPVMSRTLQHAVDQGLQIENWSLLTMIQRLMAAALSLPFIPTRSLAGSTIAQENEARGQYTEIADPFSQKKIGVISPLKPDITIMHAYCADPAGNAIPTLSSVEEAYGAFASREGVILSVEKIVSTKHLRRYSANVKVPSSIVKAVIKTPFGMHPYGCLGHTGDGYGEDVEFAKQMQTALKEKETAANWIEKWILDTKEHKDYLRKLGPERLQVLKDRASYETWKTDIMNIPEHLTEAPSNKTERAILFAAHEIIDSIQRDGYSTVLAGIGVSHLAAWTAMYLLRSRRKHIKLMVELGLWEYRPPPGQPFLASVRGMQSCPMLTDTLGILGLAANNTEMLACISAGQIDRNGNINSTKVGNLFLFGSGGANDASSTAREVIVALAQDRRRLVEKVPYITCPGHNVKKVVTDKGVFEKVGNELVLKKIYIHRNETEGEAILSLKANMEWDPEISKNLIHLGEPPEQQTLLLRCFDPDRHFLGNLERTTSENQ